MKKIITCALLALQVLSLYADNENKTKTTEKSPPEEIKDVKNIIKLNFGQVGSNGALGLFYESMLTSNMSASIGVFGKYNSTSVGNWNGQVGSEKTTGWGFMPEVRFYALPNYHAPRGLYLSGFYNYYNETFEEKGFEYSGMGNNYVNTEGKVTSTFNAVGATIGWVFRIKSSFVIDLGIGPVFQSTDSPAFYNVISANGNSYQRTSPYQSSANLTGIFRFSLGYAF